MIVHFTAQWKVMSKIIPASIANQSFQDKFKLSNCIGHFPTSVDLSNFDSKFSTSLFPTIFRSIKSFRSSCFSIFQLLVSPRSSTERSVSLQLIVFSKCRFFQAAAYQIHHQNLGRCIGL